jgi:hypothetical protein
MLGGAGAEMFEVNWSTALQEQVPAELLSRVSSYDALGSYALSPLGTILAGPATLLVGLTATLAGSGVLIVASAVCVLCVAEVRHLTRRGVVGAGSEGVLAAPEASAGRAPSS